MSNQPARKWLGLVDEAIVVCILVGVVAVVVIYSGICSGFLGLGL